MSTEQNVTGQKALHNKNDYNGNVQAPPPHHAASFKVQALRYQSKRITYPLFACSFSVRVPVCKTVASKGLFGYVSEKCII